MLVLMPTAKDGERMRVVLADAEVAIVVCRDMQEFCEKIADGAAIALLTEEAVTADHSGCLAQVLRAQPAWSDLPLVVIARPGAGEARSVVLREAMNATLVERPLRARSLISVVRGALLARRHQYELRDHLLERERDAAALRESEARARNLLDTQKAFTDNMNEGLYSVDEKGLVTYLNPAAEALFGWTSAELIGRRMHNVIHYKHLDGTPFPEEECAGLGVLRDGTPCRDHDDVFIRKDGSFFPVIFSASPLIKDGRRVGLVVVFRDVTERRQAEDAMARLAAIVESSDDAIVSKTLDGVIRSWNSGAERLFGYTADEAVGQQIMLIIPRELQEQELEILARLRRGDRIENFETVRVTKSGRRLDVSLTMSPILDGAGRVIGASKVARDITERKRTERALRQADRRKDEFLALLAHELRNPLAPIRNGLQIMRLTVDLNALAATRGMMERQLSHMVRLIDDLLDVSRINEDKLELRRSRVSLADVISSAVETARPLIDDAKHELFISMSPEPIILDADLTRLSQVISNLLANSAKYTERGGSIWLTAERSGAEVVVTVRDTGIGIPKEALPTLFNMFSQVGRSIDRSAGGLGIGLALVKTLVEMHGGSVTAASDGPGRGSTFVVRLPALGNDARRAPTKSEDNGQASSGPKRRILVADDNRDSAASMTMLLGLLGNEVRAAHDGEEALKVAEAFRPEVVLMDVGMPKLDGYEATRRIREQPWGEEMVIVALTGWGQAGDRAQSMAAGCDGHLVKPVNLPDLKNLLAESAPELERNPRSSRLIRNC
jgi:PAS domain S-box-containing protein